MSEFVHLRVVSAFSLLGSMLQPKAIAKWAEQQQMPAIGVTDIGNLYGALELSEALANVGVQPVMGLNLKVIYKMELGRPPILGELALYAQNQQGWLNLMALSSQGYLNAESHHGGVPIQFLREHNDGLLCLSGGYGSYMSSLLRAGQVETASDHLSGLEKLFPNKLYVEFQRDGRENEAIGADVLCDMAYDRGLPIIATSEARFLEPDDYGAHDALNCISEGSYLGQTDRVTFGQQQYLSSAEEMAARFSDIPEAIETTVEFARRCAFRPVGHDPILPRFDGEGGRDEASELRVQAKEGLNERLAEVDKLYATRETYDERLNFELDIIEKMGFPGYFLIVSDFMKWSVANDIPVGPGRGSGAGSVVAWALKITGLDPLRFGLLFERFLNPERVSMPDFDIDFCQDRRSEVIDYVRRKYGDDRVAAIITFGTLQAKAVVRDVGRVMQLPFGQVDRIAKMIPFNPASPPKLADAIEEEPRLQEARDAEQEVADLLEIALQLEGLYRNASTHAAGVVIADRPITELAPLYYDPRSPLPATQYNMKWVEIGGLVKFDFLGLKTLTVIDRALKFIARRGVEIGEKWQSLDDPAAYEVMAKGDTLGVFQMEGQGMRDTLRKAKPDKIEDVIALISLYRPGPMKNIDTFVDVKFGRKEPDYLHPDLVEILEETYGVIVYQEQVMRIAQILANYSLGEADLLRRAMGKKKKEEMDKQKIRFVEGAEKNNVPKPKAEYIFELVAEFAGYGFNKSHAAAYAVIAYQTAFLKAHFPCEFLAASMSLDLHNTDKLAAFVEEARRKDIEVIAPDINTSEADFDVRQGKIVYALGAIKAVGLQAMQSICTERDENGNYQDLADFAARVDPRTINKKAFEALASAGAFDRLEQSRAIAKAGAEILSNLATSSESDRQTGQSNLFGEDTKADVILPYAEAWSMTETLANEFSSIGFYLSGHPLDDVIMGKATSRIVLAHNCAEAARERGVFEMIGILREKSERPSRNGGRFAFLTLSDPSGEFEAFVPPEVLEVSRDYLEIGSTICCVIKARIRDEELRLTVDRIDPLDIAQIAGASGLGLYLDKNADLPGLKSLFIRLAKLNATRRGPVKLFCRLQDGGQVEIDLPGQYPVDTSAVAALKSARGVARVQELG